MKKEIHEFHAEFCKTFSNPKRLEIMCLLKEGEMTVSDITKKLGISKANMSQHLTVMRATGILKTRKKGTNIYYGIANKKITQACGLMQDALAHLIAGITEVSKQEVLAAMKGAK